MADTTITFGDTPCGAFLRGDYVSLSGGYGYRFGHPATLMRIEDVPSDTTMTVRWVWWKEDWFRYLRNGLVAMLPIIYVIFC